MFTIALIGCGRIGNNQIDGFAGNAEKLTLTALCDPVIERAREKKIWYRKKILDANISVYADYREMLSKQKPDIVSIATESGNHHEIAITCLEAGCHVICEKPMALSTENADKMILAAKKNNRKLGVCFQNRFNAPVRKLRAAIDAGRFGRIFHGMVQVRWSRDDAYYKEALWRGTWEQDGGTLMNQCIHGIDLLQWMMGEDAVRVHAQTRRFLRPIEAEDFGAAIIEFKSGALGIIEGCADIYPTNLNETLSIFGEKGTVVIGGLSVNKTESWLFADADLVGDTEEKVLGENEDDSSTVYGLGHTALFKDFINAIEEDKKPAISGEDGRKALEIILAIYKSQKTGLPVDLPCDFSTLEMKGYFE